jgi:pyruvate dehydrogenase E1 component beta subunit
MKVLTLIEAVTDALRTEMAADRSVIVFGEDVGVEGGVFRATAGLQNEFGEERCFDTPISEAGIVGAAVGMAVAGLRPVVEIQFSGFSFPAACPTEEASVRPSITRRAWKPSSAISQG